MSSVFMSPCPHCGKTITIPLDEIRSHIFRELAHKSVAKRKDLKEHLAKILRHRWDNDKREMHPTEKAILELSKQEQLDNLSNTQIADKIGLTGKHRQSYVSKFLRHLKAKGLVEDRPRLRYTRKQQDILDLAAREDISKLTLEQIADKVGISGPYKAHYAWRRINSLQKRGLLQTIKRRP